MLKIYINTVSRKWFNRHGGAFPDGQPGIPYGNTEHVVIQCCSATPNEGSETVNPETDWTRDTQFNFSGVGAMLSCDNNFIRRKSGTLDAPLESGAVETIQLRMNNPTIGTVPESGTIHLFSESGVLEAVQYVSRAISGDAVVFGCAENSEIENSYPVHSSADVPESLYMQSVMDAADSDPATGRFAFDITAMSAKLREATESSDVSAVPNVKGLEFLIYTVGGNDEISTRGWFFCKSFQIPVPMAEVNPNPLTPQTATDLLIGLISATLGRGIDMEFSADASSYHATQGTEDRYVRFRLHGTTSWTALSMPGGTPGYSAYELAVAAGYTGTQSEWIASLKGADGNSGKSAYELAVSLGYNGTIAEWLNSMTGQSAYELAMSLGYNGTITEWIASLRGAPGDGLHYDRSGTLAQRALYDGEDAGFKFAVSTTDSTLRTTTLHIYTKKSSASGDWSDPLDLTIYGAEGTVTMIAPVEFTDPPDEAKYFFVDLSDYPNASAFAVVIDTDEGEYTLPYASDLGVRKIVKKDNILRVYFGSNVQNFETGRLYLSQMMGSSSPGSTAVPSYNGVMYYGSTTQISDCSDFTAAMLADLTSADAGVLGKTGFGTVSAGALEVVLIPAAANLKAEKFDGISGYGPFPEDNGGTGTGANGETLTLNGTAYKIYGNFKLTSAASYFRVVAEEE